MLEEVQKIGDYQGMDTDAVSAKLLKILEKSPKDILILCAWGVKNGGIMDQASLDKFSGTEQLRGVVARLGIITKVKKVKSAPPAKDAVTVPRVLTFFHTVCINMVGKWNTPAAAGIEFPHVADPLFTSTFGPYMLSPADDPAKGVYNCLLEWNCAHHDQVNPDKVGEIKAKFSKTIFDLKIRTSAVDKESKSEWTKKILLRLTEAKYVAGSTHKAAWARNGLL
jgi:hypothetical protein